MVITSKGSNFFTCCDRHWLVKILYVVDVTRFYLTSDLAIGIEKSYKREQEEYSFGVC